MAAIAALAGMTVFAHLAPERQLRFEQCIEEPARFAGALLISSLTPVLAVEDRALVVRAADKTGRILLPPGAPDDVRVGQAVSAVGRFEPPDRIAAEKLHVHRRRPWKVRLSLIGLLGAGILGIASFRWDRGAGRLVPRGEDR